MSRTKDLEILSRLYDWDPAAKAFVVKVAIGDYCDVFNELDPSPLRKRDIDDALFNYLYDCSKDIPLSWNLRIEFVADDTERDRVKEERVRKGLHTNFDFIILYLKREIAGIFRRSVLWVGVSLGFLLASFTLNAKLPQGLLSSTIVEGLSIGGWVFLWEAMALTAFRSREKTGKLGRYRRLRHASKTFRYLP